eukprot:666221-Prorocentrum_lima.AAC.1
MTSSLVGSEMCIRDRRLKRRRWQDPQQDVGDGSPIVGSLRRALLLQMALALAARGGPAPRRASQARDL